jgi:hypothetical protein
MTTAAADVTTAETAPETWRDVAGYEGLYRVSDLGRVMSLHRQRERLIKPTPGPDGYFVRLCMKAKGIQNFQLHRLVLMTFHPISNPKDYWVSPRNGDHFDARLVNLAWVPRSGDHAPNTTLTEAAVKDIRALWADGEGLTQAAIARRYNVSRVCITHILSGRTWAGVK